jgi:glycosyltransferase involved in cell wall biosynthesis
MSSSKTNIKCCQLTTVHPQNDVRVYHKMAKTLAEAGYDVHFIVPADTGATMPGVTLHTLPKDGGRFSRIWRRQPIAFKTILKLKPAIVHFHDPELLLLGLILRILGYKVIYDVHEDVAKQILEKSWISPKLRRVVSRTFRFFEVFAAKRMSAVVIAWTKIADGLQGTKCTLIRNYPSLKEFSTPDLKNVVQSDQSQFIYVGGLTEERGIGKVVEAIGLVRSRAELVLGGAFSDSSFYDQVQTLDGWQKTIFKGWLNRSQVADAITNARAGVLTMLETPNHMVLLPIKMFEYFAAGKPIIASHFPYWKELSEGNGIFVDPSNPQAIADAMDWMIDNQTEAEAMGERGRKMVFEKCNWEKESQHLLELYARTLYVA